MIEKSVHTRQEDSNASAPQTIIILDSGLGGLRVLEALRKDFPCEQFLYFADTRYFPYGEKSVQFLQCHLAELCEYLITEYKPKLLVLGCNTATVSALNSLRKRFSVPIVGVLPAIKYACRKTRLNTLACLATRRTLVSAVYLNSVERARGQGVSVQSVACDDCVAAIERGKDFVHLLLSALERVGDFDVLVLGCTHYSLVRETIQNVLPEVLVVDSVYALLREVQQVLRPRRNEICEENAACAIVVNGDVEAFLSDARNFLELPLSQCSEVDIACSVG